MEGNDGVYQLSRPTRACSSLCEIFFCSRWSGTEIIRLHLLRKPGQGLTLKRNWQSLGGQRLLYQRIRELSCLLGGGILQPSLVGTSTCFCQGLRSCSVSIGETKVNKPAGRSLPSARCRVCGGVSSTMLVYPHAG